MSWFFIWQRGCINSLTASRQRASTDRKSMTKRLKLFGIAGRMSDRPRMDPHARNILPAAFSQRRHGRLRIMNAHRIAAALLLLTICAVPPPVLAQYIGQNRVRYEDLISKSSRPSTSTFITTMKKAVSVQALGRMAERWYARLSDLLQHELSQPSTCNHLCESSTLPRDDCSSRSPRRNDWWRD